MPARNDALKARLSRSREIKVGVTGRNSGRTISIPVWFVLEDEKLYLLTVLGSDTQWYKNVLKNRLIRIDERAVQRRNFRPFLSLMPQGLVGGREIPRQVRGQRCEEVLFKVRRCCLRSDALKVCPRLHLVRRRHFREVNCVRMTGITGQL